MITLWSVDPLSKEDDIEKPVREIVLISRDSQANEPGPCILWWKPLVMF